KLLPFKLSNPIHLLLICLCLLPENTSFPFHLIHHNSLYKILVRFLPLYSTAKTDIKAMNA
ncbi:MAG: hypothetical protein NUV76_10945, partial [Candidatus Kuenenia sp.]|nr:hypothetical protein [Candidatus Kuenenia sp.]